MVGDTDYVNSFAHWQPDEEMHTCLNCQAPFSFLVRKHHCRCCGGIFCASCTDNFARYDRRRVKVVKRHSDDDEFAPYRTCQSCYDNLLHLKVLLSAWGKPLEPLIRPASPNPISVSTLSSRADSPSATAGSNEVLKNSNEIEITSEIISSERGAVRPHHIDDHFCPICNIDLIKFDAEEDAQTHVQDCIAKAVLIQQHQEADYDVGNLSPSFQNRMLVYKVAKADPDVVQEYQECPICFEEMLPGEKVGRLECLCVFHYKCIKEWFNKKLQKMKAKDAKYVGKNFCPLHDAVF